MKTLPILEGPVLVLQGSVLVVKGPVLVLQGSVLVVKGPVPVSYTHLTLPTMAVV